MIKALSKSKPKIGKFSKKEADKYRKVFYDIKNFRHLSESETEEIRKKFNELEKRLMFKKFHGDIDTVDYHDLDNYDYNYDFSDMMNTENLEALEHYLKCLIELGFAGRNNNYIEYVSKGDKYENLSPEEHLNMIRPYLRNLINEHIPTMELNNNKNNNNNKF